MSTMLRCESDWRIHYLEDSVLKWTVNESARDSQKAAQSGTGLTLNSKVSLKEEQLNPPCFSIRIGALLYFIKTLELYSCIWSFTQIKITVKSPLKKKKKKKVVELPLFFELPFLQFPEMGVSELSSYESKQSFFRVRKRFFLENRASIQVATGTHEVLQLEKAIATTASMNSPLD